MRGAATAALLTLELPGKPVPASRPRMTKTGHAFIAKPYREWVTAHTPEVKRLDAVPTDRPIALMIETVTERPKTTKFTTPMGDVDNFAKGPMDLLTKLGKGWLDDRQIVFLVSTKRWAEDGEQLGFSLTWTEVNDDEPFREDD